MSEVLKLQLVASELDLRLNPGRKPGGRRRNGFMLITFPHGVLDKPRMVMTCDSEDAQLVLKVILAQLEGRISDEDIGRAD